MGMGQRRTVSMENTWYKIPKGKKVKEEGEGDKDRDRGYKQAQTS